MDGTLYDMVDGFSSGVMDGAHTRKMDGAHEPEMDGTQEGMMDGVGGGLRHNKEQKSGVAYQALHPISKGVYGTLVRSGVLVQGIGWCTRWSI